MSAEIVLEALQIEQNYTTGGSGGLDYNSDMITYPRDLQRVEDTTPKTCPVAYLAKHGYVYNDQISFELHGEFRPYEETIIDDPNSVVTPVMANVYITLGQSSDMSSESKLSISFKAETTPFGTAQDPRIRFVCEGHYDPALVGDTRFHAVVEVDQNANVNVVELQTIMGDGVLADNSPQGFSVGFND